jgi:alpha-ketoglutarate-dependent taurine dioxygenase/4-hydroxybenzoate polyprenyltransferase
MNPQLTPLHPFGVRVEVEAGTSLASIDLGTLQAWLDQYRVVQLRGLRPEPPHELAASSRRLGPLQPWPFGAVHELKQVARTENYLYTEHAVPLHWDGAFADAVPHWLVFECMEAPEDGAGGETVFVDTPTVIARATNEQRERWGRARFRFSTEKKAHYGGSFIARTVARHPTLNIDVLRYAEPVEDLNPVTVEALDVEAAEGHALMTELSTALAAPEAVLALPWKKGDFVIADNHALLHGRRAFVNGAPRHLYRVNVLDPDKRWWATLRAAWRVRRPEFFRAELPILLIPALLSASNFKSLASLNFLEGAVLFFLLFNVGDMINCWLDRDVDLHRKTHLAEAIARVGRGSLLAQIIGSAVAAAAIGVHLAVSLNRPWLAPTGILGAVLGASYTAPPLRLKGRGLLQIGAYIGLLFVGPMVMIAGLFTAFPSPILIAVALAYGLMQTGVLLVNTAEDLDEDEREGIRTAAVALGAHGSMRAALLLSVVGALSLIAMFVASLNHFWQSIAVAPLLAVLVYNTRWLTRLATSTKGEERAARAAIRDQGKYVPRHIEAGAWAAAFAALAVFIGRLL